jgi:hypothetical protein
MAGFARGNSVNLNSLEFNLSTEKFLQSIQSKGFAIDKISDSSMPNTIQTAEAKERFLKRPAKEIKNVFDKVEDGEIVSAKRGKDNNSFRRQTVDSDPVEKVDDLFKDGLSRITK